MPDKVKLTLPEYVVECPHCNGTGVTQQTYTAGCGGGYYKSDGPCPICKDDDMWWQGVGYVYRATARPVGRSVLAQIATLALNTPPAGGDNG